jgi:uncharacterized protein
MGSYIHLREESGLLTSCRSVHRIVWLEASMSEQENVKFVKEIYGAFLRGDIPSVLSTMSDDVDFFEPGEGAYPTSGHRRGLAEMREFFRILDETTKFETFEPREYIAQGDKVVVLGTYTGIAKPTGRRFGMDWAMVWTIRDGKAVKFHEYTDTLAGANAFRKETAEAAV